MTDLQVGQWVRVWGQVKVTPDQDGVHPEDAAIELWSHMENYLAHVRLDHIDVSGGIPDFAEQCSHLMVDPLRNGIYVRCSHHDGHDGLHTAPSVDGEVYSWESEKTSGYIET